MKIARSLAKLSASLFGTARAESLKSAPLTTISNPTEPKEEKAVCPFGRRWRQRQSRSPGVCRYRKVRQILTNPKFMHRSQRERFAKGETIFV